MTLTGALYELGDGARPILSVIKADLELLQLQPIPDGQAMAITDLDGVQCNTHEVLSGVVVPVGG